MPPTSSVPPALRHLADLQGGIVLLSQVLGTGMSRKALDRLLASGQWLRVDRGLFLTRTSPFDWSAAVWAASLTGGTDAVIGSVSALAWHGLIDAPGPVITYVPLGTRLAGRTYAAFRRTDAARQVMTRKGLMVTSVTDALVDASADLSPADLEGAITKAAQRRLLSIARLNQLLSSRRSAPQRELLRSVTIDAQDGAHSSLELSYLRAVERPHGLPAGTRQHHAGGEYRDVAYEEFGVIVELDGLAHHLGAGFRDRRRDNRNARGAWLTLRYGSADITGDACSVALEVAETLTSRGWTELPTSCGRC